MKLPKSSTSIALSVLLLLGVLVERAYHMPLPEAPPPAAFAPQAPVTDPPPYTSILAPAPKPLVLEVPDEQVDSIVSSTSSVGHEHEVIDEALEALAMYHYDLMDSATRDKFLEKFSKELTDDESVHSERGLSVALKKILLSLDRRFDYYLDRQATDQEQELMDGHFGGLGLPMDIIGNTDKWHELIKNGKVNADAVKAFRTVTEETQVIVREEPSPDTPAQAAGIKKGDRIVAIDGVTLDKLDLPRQTEFNSIAKHLRGKIGTPVKVKLLSARSGEPYEVEMVRAKIEDPVVFFREVGDNKEVAYVKLVNFISDLVPAKMEAALKEAAKKQATVLDFRRNTGGNIEYAKLVMQMLIEKGEILKTVGREGPFRVVTTYTLTPDMLIVETTSTNPAVQRQFQFLPRTYKRILPAGQPVVVMINGLTASASEIVAGALRETAKQALDRGEKPEPIIILGTGSIGKGEYQDVLNIDEGRRMLHITAGEFLPGGEAMNWTGLVPDVEVQLNDDADPVGRPESDNQLARATEVIKDVLSGKPLPKLPEAEMAVRKAKLKKVHEEFFAQQRDELLKQLKNPEAVEPTE